jgi:hypothetical protein
LKHRLDAEYNKTKGMFSNPIMETENAITYFLDDKVYQLIKKFGSKEEIIGEFNFENSKVILEYPFNEPKIMSKYKKEILYEFIPSETFKINDLSHIKHMRKYALNKNIQIPKKLIKEAVKTLQKGKIKFGKEYDTKDVEVPQKIINTQYFGALEIIPNFWDVYNEMYKESKDNHILYHLLLSDSFLEEPYVSINAEKIEDKLLKYFLFPNLYFLDDYVGKNYPELLI